MRQFELLDVREAPAGFSDGVLLLVTFSYVAAEFDAPLEVTQYSKKNEREYTVASIVGARAVKVDGASLRVNKAGRPWLSARNLKVPDEVLSAVADAAHKLDAARRDQAKAGAARRASLGASSWR